MKYYRFIGIALFSSKAPLCIMTGTPGNENWWKRVLHNYYDIDFNDMIDEFEQIELA